MGRSEERVDKWGEKYTLHIDDNGKITGESRQRVDKNGPYVEHRDAAGHKTGESRQRTDKVSTYIEHTDADGRKTGESRERNDYREGGAYVEHTDQNGNVVGKSKQKSDYRYGGRYTETQGHGFGASGHSSSSSGSSGGGSSSGGGCCFTAVACLQARRLPDDCYELQVIRRLRDSYVRGLPVGSEIIADYYKKSPKIVEAISRIPDASMIFESIFLAVKKAVLLTCQLHKFPYQ